MLLHISPQIDADVNGSIVLTVSWYSERYLMPSSLMCCTHPLLATPSVP
jgi:hypothetical protein